MRLEITGSMITRINPVIDQLMAGLAGVVGGGTLLRYASDVASLPTSLLQATLFPVLLTRLAYEAKRPPQFAATLAEDGRLRRGIARPGGGRRRRVSASALRPALWARRHGPAGVAHIASILPWALLGAAPFGALLVLARAHVALQNSRIMPSMGIVNSVLNAAFNALFVGSLGLSGIALSTSVTYAVVAAVFWLRLPRSARA